MVDRCASDTKLACQSSWLFGCWCPVIFQSHLLIHCLLFILDVSYFTLNQFCFLLFTFLVLVCLGRASRQPWKRSFAVLALACSGSCKWFQTAGSLSPKHLQRLSARQLGETILQGAASWSKLAPSRFAEPRGQGDKGSRESTSRLSCCLPIPIYRMRDWREIGKSKIMQIKGQKRARHYVVTPRWKRFHYSGDIDS